MARTRVLIAGAAGRDFHNFNLVYRDSPAHEVVAFTATQIPNIDGRRYPAELAGSLYPQGIPILPESALEQLVREHEIDVVVFAYSDVTHQHVMHIGSRALAAGASCELRSGRRTSSSGTVATTTLRSSNLTCTSSSSTRTARDTSSATTPVRRTSAWRMSASSTRWTVRHRRASTQFSARFTRTTRTHASSWPRHPSTSKATPRRSRESACSRWKTDRR